MSARSSLCRTICRKKPGGNRVRDTKRKRPEDIARRSEEHIEELYRREELKENNNKTSIEHAAPRRFQNDLSANNITRLFTYLEQNAQTKFIRDSREKTIAIVMMTAKSLLTFYLFCATRYELYVYESPR